MRKYIPALFVLATACAWLFTGVVLTLYGPYFHTALLNTLSRRVLLPEQILFHGWQLTPTIWGLQPVHPPLSLAGPQALLMLAAMMVVFLLYIFALRYLPRFITLRFILISTGILGLVCAITPVVTSQDIYSYIIYDRMIVYHHVNPLTTIPSSIPSDPAFIHLYWPNQPSAYGPTYIAITAAMQLVLGHLFGHDNVGVMVVGLRLLSLAAHLCSIWLIWKIGGLLLKGTPLRKQNSGELQQGERAGSRETASSGTRSYQNVDTFTQRRLLATLAFAWNPLLLFEAAVNAHNDILLLLCILLALWAIVRTPAMTFTKALIVSTILALATCLKVNIVLLLPGFLLFLWWNVPLHRLKILGASAALYVGLIVILYAPFWQNGNLLHVLAVNPGTMYNENTLVDTLDHLYNSVAQAMGAAPAVDVGSPAEIFLHRFSLFVFVVLYLFMLWRIIFRQRGMHTTLQLISWLTWSWLLYCAVGAPWFWPWYLALFFGFFALLEIAADPPLPDYLLLAVRVLACSMVSLYIFFTWGAFKIYFPLLPNFRWSFWRGFWAWLLPLGVLGWIWARQKLTFDYKKFRQP